MTAPPSETAAIIGCGTVGRAWAARFLRAGWAVNVFDPDAAAARQLVECCDLAVETPRCCRTISQAVERAGWIQICVADRLALTRKVIQAVQLHCSPMAVIAVATRELAAADLQGCAARPQQIIVARISPGAGIDLDLTGRNPQELERRARQFVGAIS